MKLKRFRQITAVTVVFLFSIIFFDIYGLVPHGVQRVLTSFQFIPSLLFTFAYGVTLVSAGFIVVFLLTLLSGRSYCSFLCPLGIIQDLSSRIFKRKKYIFMKEMRAVRYTILAVTAAVTAVWGSLLLVWLDPYSLFGRFMGNFLNKFILALNNAAAEFLLNHNIFSLYSVNGSPGTVFSVIVSAVPVFLIIIVASRYGRLYCNTVCPVGTFLGIVSRFSVVKIGINSDTCLHCGICDRSCKSSCIDSAEGLVDFTRCVSCFNCVSMCPNGSISFERRYGKAESLNDSNRKSSPSEKGAISRFSFITGMLVMPPWISALAVENKKLFMSDGSKLVKFTRKTVSSPPGSVERDRFNELCTSCSLCITKCPTRVLQPAVMHYGMRGIMQPYMDYSAGYCNYDCTLCGSVCPTGAIKKLSVEKKRVTSIGKVIFIKENCITFQQETVCGACSEHCPTKAVYMVPYKNGLVIPATDRSICIGCGACENVCPVRPVKAIHVEGELKHTVALKPAEKKSDQKQGDEFPF